VRPGQSELQDRGRKGVADKSALNYEAYRLYSVDQVLGSVQNLLGHILLIMMVVSTSPKAFMSKVRLKQRLAWCLDVTGSMAQCSGDWWPNGQHLSARRVTFDSLST
jgi:hypothetical protein